jgi:hypothetical protein
MSPGFEFQNAGETLWCHIRGRLQDILQFDEEWIVDTPRSETLWAETCQQNDIVRSAAAAQKTTRAPSGTIGFSWWAWFLPQHVDLVPTASDGVWRLRARTTLGKIEPSVRSEMLPLLDGFHTLLPGGALVIDEAGNLQMVFAIGLDRSMAEEISQFTAGILHRQVAYGGYLALRLESAGMLTRQPMPHPVMGVREDADEFVATLFAVGPTPAPSQSGRPASPEGASLAAVFDPNLPAQVAQETGWSLRGDLCGPGETLLTNQAGGDVATYFAYKPVEESTSAGLTDLRNDPYLSVRMQIATTGNPVVHASEVAALEEANERLWAAWESGAANVLGGFAVVEGPQGFYVSGPRVLWPAASFEGPARQQGAATVLSHLFSHLGDQALNARTAGHTTTTPPADRSGEMREMLNHLRGLDKKSKEFAALRNDLSALLQAHPHPGEVAEIRSELARLLW